MENIFLTQVERTPAAIPDKTKDTTRTGLFKNIWNYDPRSPSLFLRRTPLFRNSSSSKFAHQELNETCTSIESQVDLNILTVEEQDSLDLNKDLASSKDVCIEDVFDPRSPITEITRTPIVFGTMEEAKKSKIRKEDSLIKKLADILVSTSIANDIKEKDDDKPCEKSTVKKIQNRKNLIYEDDENMGFSTPPKKASLRFKDASVRTPLGCVANTQTPKSHNFLASTPKSKFSLNDENHKSRIPVSARRLQ